MEILDIEVKTAKSLTLPFDEVQLMPIGDVQLGSDGVDVDRLKRQLEWAMDQEAHGAPPVYFLGMGDYIDALSPSNRQVWRGAKMYDVAQQMMNDQAEEFVAQFLQITRGTEGKWLGLLEGHHYYPFEDGTTSDTRIAHALKSTFLGSCAFVRMAFRRETPSQSRALACVIWCHHGVGNGIFPHTPLNKLYHVMHAFEADIYLIGHQTKKPVVKAPRIYLSERPPYRLVARNKVLAGTGGFSLGYLQGSRAPGNKSLPRGGYVEQKMLNPVSLGSVLIRIRPVHTARGDRIDLNVEV